MNKKHIYKIDFALITISCLILLFMVSFTGFKTPYIIAPIDNLTTSQEDILFSFENGNQILIDDNPEMTSPRVINVKDNLVITLESGVYYWQVQGLLKSEVRRFTIKSKIDLRMKKLQGKYVLTNAGNVDLNIEVYNQSKWQRNFTLIKDKSQNVSGTKFIGEEDEN